jgi:hypothetical protein
MNKETKYWSLTWDTNIKQRKLPNEEVLLSFFDKVADECVFQFEKGKTKGKLHIQGVFTLLGPRQSKKNTLELFQKKFKNIAGLTISPVYDKIAIKAYVTKEQGRVKGPFYGGKMEMYDQEMAKMKLRQWQKELFEILTGEDQKMLRDRKVIWIQDAGNTGKSWFQKWLRIGQRKLTVRALPVSRVDRLISAVAILSKTVKVDVYTIDLTRTKGEEQSYKDLFSVVEQIKNGHVVDVMYGKYNEAIFQPPMIIIFTNNKIEEFEHFLSPDRWVTYSVSPDGILARRFSAHEFIRVSDLYKLKKKD